MNPISALIYIIFVRSAFAVGTNFGKVSGSICDGKVIFGVEE